MHTVVFVRHGQSEWNLANRFTGWTDVDLTEQGQAEARAGAQLLKAAGLDFDLCHTSFLKRAIRTLWIILDGLDRMWLPVARTWRLNERHYGTLQGLNKAETSARYGEEQVFLWRRGYAVSPPELEESDQRWPGHDRRYQGPELEREPEARPHAESLETTIARTMPYWNEVMAPQIRAGRRLLVVAHGNSLRGIVKHLERLSDEAITKVNIPTGVPLVYELDEDLGVQGKRYLGDPEAVARAQRAVADQAKT